MVAREVPLDRGGLEILDEDTILDLLSEVPIGRIAFADGDRLDIVTVAHAIRDDRVVVMARPGSPLRAAAGRQARCAFEADAYDPARRTGWSVIAQGTLDLAADPGGRESPAGTRSGSVPDPAGPPALVQVHTDRITGRRIPRGGGVRPRSSLDGAPLALHRVAAMDAEQCVEMLEASPVGRVGFVMHDVPLIMPVNHTMEGRDVVFRTARGSKLDVAQQRAGGTASFQIDAFDPDSTSGWSVLVTGHMHPVLDQMQVGRLERKGVDAWADAVERPRWIRIVPTRVTGSRLSVGGATG